MMISLAVAGAVWAQESAEAAPDTVGVFTDVTDVRVANLEVFVTDRSGEPIVGLTQDEFELHLDGERVPITNFYAEVGGEAREAVAAIDRPAGDDGFMPLEAVAADPARRAHVLLLIDHTRIGAVRRQQAFKALRSAVAELDDDDLVAVAGIEGSVVFYSDFLFDRAAIGDVLDDVSEVSLTLGRADVERRQILGELQRGLSGGLVARSTLAEEGPLLNRIQAYAAEEYDRGLRSLRQIQTVASTLGGIPGRKALIYVSEGIPTRPGEGLFVEWRNRFGGGNPEAAIGMRRFDFNKDYIRSVGNYDLTRAVDQAALAANQAGVTLYGIDADARQGLALRSVETEQGATSEAVSVVAENFRAPLESVTQQTGGRLLRASGRLSEQLGSLMNDFDTYYSLGFKPPADWQPGSDHRVEVKVDRRRARVRYREALRVERQNEREAGATVAALLYNTVDNPLGISATLGSEAPRDDGTAALPVQLAIPVGELTLVPKGGTSNLSLSIYISIQDAEGNPGPVQAIPFHLAIPQDKVEAAKGDAAHYTLPLVLRPGDRRVAISVRDDVSRKMSTVRLDVAQYSDLI
ncbi:MAG: VWA domain-containing protein [Acidobacteriota bacterium]